MTQSTLFVVATPIGNLEDLTPRALSVLKSVELIAAEDTRHSKKLMMHYGIDTPLVAYHDHSGEQQDQQLVKRLQNGESIALISDAGTPLISDPGYRLVRAAHLSAIRVVPIPGACAFIAALSASGLPSDRFSFEGFLPAKSLARQQAIRELEGESRTLIFYEAPHRILDCLADLSAELGEDREAVLARELTKTFETIWRGTLQDLLAFVESDPNQRRGEMVVLVRGANARETSELTPDAERIMLILVRDLPPKQASRLGEEITGVPKKQLYQWAVAQKR